MAAGGVCACLSVCAGSTGLSLATGSSAKQLRGLQRPSILKNGGSTSSHHGLEGNLASIGLVATSAAVLLGSRKPQGRHHLGYAGGVRTGISAMQQVSTSESRHDAAVSGRGPGSEAAPIDGIGANPATSWPEGKPAWTVEYPEVYDLSDPKGSFTRVGRTLLKEMLSELPHLYEIPPKEVDWIERSLEYNTQGGKMNRGLIVVETGVAIMKHQGREPTNADLNRFAVLGWAIEYLQACMLMADDMMDGSLTRRGNPCWYRLPNVGMLNTNDFLMVEMFVYKLIKRHFGREQIYSWLIDLFLETTFQTECGQLLDSICANCELEELTTQRWTLIVKYKTAFYSFYLPVAAAMLVCGERNRATYDTAREALLLMGVYFQAQDDYLDAFACPEELGKVGTDIQDKKCSWLFAHAYHEYSTPEAKAYLEKHYGKCQVGSEEEQAIKELYKDLGLQDLFQKYESSVQTDLQEYKKKITDCGLPWSVFEMFFAMIHKRRK